MPYDLSWLKDIDENSYKPMNVQLSEVLTDFITRAKLVPGDPFPSESELIERFGVSRMTVRAALIRIATEGLIYKIQGKGTFVAEPRLSQKISDFESVETSLERQGITVVSQPLEVIQIHPMPIWLNNLGLSPDDKVTRSTRLKRIDDRILAIEHVFLPLPITDRFEPQELENEPIIELFNKHEETAVHRIVNVTKSHIIFEFEASLLEIGPDSPVLTRRFIFYNKKNLPVATGRITFVAELMEVEVDLIKQNGNPESIKVKY